MILSKNVNNKKCAPKLVLFNEKKVGKIQMIFDPFIEYRNANPAARKIAHPFL